MYKILKFSKKIYTLVRIPQTALFEILKKFRGKISNFIGEEQSCKLTKLTEMLSNKIIMLCIKYTKSTINLHVSQ